MDVRTQIQLSAKGNLSHLLYIHNSPIHGFGLFSNEEIKSGTLIHETHVWSESHNAYINILPNCNYNHSYEPNCQLNRYGNIFRLESIKDIEPYTELLVDYSKNPDIEQPKKDWK